VKPFRKQDEAISNTTKPHDDEDDSSDVYVNSLPCRNVGLSDMRGGYRGGRGFPGVPLEEKFQ